MESGGIPDVAGNIVVFREKKTEVYNPYQQCCVCKARKAIRSKWLHNIYLELTIPRFSRSLFLRTISVQARLEMRIFERLASGFFPNFRPTLSQTSTLARSWSLGSLPWRGSLAVHRILPTWNSRCAHLEIRPLGFRPWPVHPFVWRRDLDIFCEKVWVLAAAWCSRVG